MNVLDTHEDANAAAVKRGSVGSEHEEISEQHPYRTASRYPSIYWYMIPSVQTDVASFVQICSNVFRVFSEMLFTLVNMLDDEINGCIDRDVSKEALYVKGSDEVPLCRRDIVEFRGNQQQMKGCRCLVRVESAFRSIS